MFKRGRSKTARVITAIALLCCCIITFGGCHVFAWYIPKPYNSKETAAIYSCLDSQLDDLKHIVAGVSYEQDDGLYAYNIFADDGKTVISYDVFSKTDTATLKRGFYADGTLYEWDVSALEETVTQKDISFFGFLLQDIRKTATYFKTEVLNVMPHTDDSYCWECFPWGFGMAQMYYLPDDDSLTVTASWAVENDEDTDEIVVPQAEFHYSKKENGVTVHTYNAPFGIDETAASVKATYERNKEYDEKMLNKQIFIKGFADTLIVELYNTDAARALLDKLSEGDITLTVDDYGGFEKVGELGFDLPTDDKSTVTQYGDVMLYQGNQISIFYGQNTWEYTPIGHINGYSQTAFAGMMTKGKINIILSINAD